MSAGEELRALAPADLPRLAAWLGREVPPPGWAVDLQAPGAFGLALEQGGRTVAAGLLRSWGRTVVAPWLAVDPDERRRGLGRSLVGALREEILRRDARVAGLELPPGALGSLAAGLRLGFKPAPPTCLLEGPCGEGPEDAAPEPDDDGVRVLRSEAGFTTELSGDDSEALVRLTTTLDADLEPSAWIGAQLAEGAELVLLDDAEGRLVGFALLVLAPGASHVETAAEPEEDGPAPPSGSPAVEVVLAALTDRAPFGALSRLLSAAARRARAREARRLRLAVAGRRGELLRALLASGFELVGQRQRLLLRGHPERSDPRRALVAAWS